MSSGFIALLGRDIREIPLEELRSRIGVVPQRSVLFSGTLRENMCWGKKDATDEEIREALRIAQALPFVEEKGEGLSLLIEQEGRNLSGGQRQRLALARALLKDSPVYIFDEATSNIDAESEEAIMQAIYGMHGSHTVLLISHRLANVVGSDIIAYLESGHLKELGSHARLMEADAGYAALFRAQESLETFGQKTKRQREEARA